MLTATVLQRLLQMETAMDPSPAATIVGHGMSPGLRFQPGGWREWGCVGSEGDISVGTVKALAANQRMPPAGSEDLPKRCDCAEVVLCVCLILTCN
jgi:hypothetical protein